jgi:CPA2 family monovalent cation:H+ antiporter-2
VGSHAFVDNLALVLCVAAVTTVVFQRLRQPVVLGYVLAGLVVGPHLPIPLVADRAVIGTLSELGVILLMFAIGLELSVRRLLRVASSAGPIALIEVSVMLCLGYLGARLFGWETRTAVFAAAALSISSTTIIAKVFDERNVGAELRETVFGVLVVEDLIAILLIAALTPVARGGDLSAGELGWTAARLVGFLVALVAGGLLVVPRSMRAILRLDRPETTLVASVGVCFAVALLAQRLGYSVALGAFLAGSLVAESGETERIETLVRPVRDVFAALFFVSVGMSIEPRLIGEHVWMVLVFALLVVVGKVLAVSTGAFLAGRGVRTSVQAGLSMAQIGELSFIIAGLALPLGGRAVLLYPVAVAVSALTTLTTPWLVRASDPIARFVDRKLPRPLQTFAALYGSWVERLRAPTKVSVLRGPVRALVLDALVLAALLIGAAMWHGWLVLAAAPFAVGVVRAARRVGQLVALRALPAATVPQLDLAAAPRRVLVVALQLAVVIAIGGPLVVITEPFLGPWWGPSALLVLLVVLAVAFWRGATNLQGHVRAGAYVVAEALARQAQGDEAAPMASLQAILPGLGDPIAHVLSADSPAVGRSLRELDLRGRTGAVMLAIRRGQDEIAYPAATERLAAGDLVALAGSREAIGAARALLDGTNPKEAG